MKLQASGEMYLETIYVLSKEMSAVRSIDVGEYMGFSKPSVSRAVGLLKENGYITMDKDGLITLSETGMQIAASMLDRHKTLTKFLINLGVDEITAEADACKMEHDLGEQSYRAICAHADRHSNT